MRVNRGLLNWGVFFIALGAVPLLVRNGQVSAAAVADAWSLWPLILVGIGLGLVLRLTPLAWLGGALVAATFGLMFGALLSGSGSGGAIGCAGSEATETSSRSGLVAGDRFDLGIELTCGDVSVERAADARWLVSATHGVDEAPAIVGSTTSLDVRSPGDDAVTFFTDQGKDSWQVTVPTGPALSVGLTLDFAGGDLALGPGPVSSIGSTLNFSNAEVDLAAADLTGGASVGATLNFSSETLSLPAAQVSGGMTLNFSSLKLCVAPDAALRISHQGTLSSDDFAGAGLEQAGDAWQTPGFESATPRIDLDVTSTFSSITLDRSGGCA